jgi:hypothetical protein
MSRDLFPSKLRTLVDIVGTNASARACGVSTRSLQRWMSGKPRTIPAKCVQVGALHILGTSARCKESKEKKAIAACISVSNTQ